MRPPRGLMAPTFTCSRQQFGKFPQSEIARRKGVVAKYKLSLDL